MSALSDLDELISRAEEQQDYCSETGPNEAMKLANELTSIRAAVAELIEAAKLALSSSNKSIRESAAKALTGAGYDIAKVREEMRERDRAALARCGGAS